MMLHQGQPVSATEQRSQGESDHQRDPDGEGDLAARSEACEDKDHEPLQQSAGMSCIWLPTVDLM